MKQPKLLAVPYLLTVLIGTPIVSLIVNGEILRGTQLFMLSSIVTWVFMNTLSYFLSKRNSQQGEEEQP